MKRKRPAAFLGGWWREGGGKGVQGIIEIANVQQDRLNHTEQDTGPGWQDRRHFVFSFFLSFSFFCSFGFVVGFFLFFRGVSGEEEIRSPPKEKMKGNRKTCVTKRRKGL